MAASDNQQFYRDAGPFTEEAGEVIIDKANAGYHLDMVFTNHILQGANLGGGFIQVYAEGPAGWGEVAGGSEGTIVQVPGTIRTKRLRVVFDSTGGAGQVYLRSAMQGI